MVDSVDFYSYLEEKYGMKHKGVPCLSSRKWNKVLEKEREEDFSLVIMKGIETSFERAQIFLYARGMIENVKMCEVCSSVIPYKLQRSNNSSCCSMRCSSKSLSKKEKREKTSLEKYGVPNVSSSEEIKKRRESTFLDRYGVNSYASTSECRKKMEKTSLERYGTKIPSQSKEVQMKYKETCMERYGVENTSLIGKRPLWETQEISEREWFEDNLLSGKKSIREVSNESGYSYTSICKKLKDNGLSLKSESIAEKELNEFLNNHLGSEVNRNSRPEWFEGMELDFYIPEHKIAIEYNGLYWHSETGPNSRDRKYHLLKTELCEQNGVQLLQIFENEWEDTNKKEIWKSMILSKCGVFSTFIGARSLTVQPIRDDEKKEVRKFLNENHIQGSIGFKSGYIMRKKNSGEIISAMVFGGSRYSSDIKTELLRYCTKKNTCVIGGFRRMISRIDFSFISYGNRRWCSSINNVYDRNNMVQRNTSKPGYWYWKPKEMILEHRSKFQKHKLVSVLKKFDPGCSEFQNMVSNGYHRIWDCGNLVYEYKN